jgi:hypothetical protein
MFVVFWQAWRDIREDTAVSVNKGCHDVGLRKQHLDITTALSVGISHCCMFYVYCTMLLLTKLSDVL